MASRRAVRLRLGEGARCSTLLSKLRPSAAVNSQFPNKQPRQRLDDLRATRRQVQTRQCIMCGHVYFTSPTLPGKVLHAASRWCVVREEGNTDTLWETLAETPVPSAGEAPIVEVGVEIESSVFSAGNHAEDNDDNDPAPENIPTEAAPTEVAGGVV